MRTPARRGIRRRSSNLLHPLSDLSRRNLADQVFLWRENG